MFRAAVLNLWVMTHLGVEWSFHKGHIPNILRIRYLNYDITVAKLQLWTSKEKNFKVGDQHNMESHCIDRLYPSAHGHLSIWICVSEWLWTLCISGCTLYSSRFSQWETYLDSLLTFTLDYLCCCCLFFLVVKFSIYQTFIRQKVFKCLYFVSCFVFFMALCLLNTEVLTFDEVQFIFSSTAFVIIEISK